MRIKKYGKDALVSQIADEFKLAMDANEQMYGIELTAAEYEQVRKELMLDKEDPLHSMSGLPIYVDGKNLLEEAVETQRALIEMLKHREEGTFVAN